MVRILIRSLVTLSLLIVAYDVGAQITGGTLLPASKHQSINKSLLVNGARSVDAKFKYYDTASFKERPFISVAEANSYIPSNQRISGLTVFINSGGTLNPNGTVTGGNNNEYHYRNGTADVDLVLKLPASSSGTVTSVTVNMPVGFSVSSSNINTTPTFNISSALANGFVKSSSGSFIAASVDTSDISNFYGKVRSLFTGSANISIINGQIIYTGSGGGGGLSGFTFTNSTGITGTVLNPTTAPVLSLVLTADALTDGTTNKAFTAAEKTKLAGITTGASVTSVGLTMPTGFSVASSPVTSAGTLAVTTTLNGILRGNGSGITAGTIDSTDIASFAVKVRSVFSAGSGLNFVPGTGVFTNTGVLSVNGNTGALAMDTGYIAGFAGKVRAVHSAGAGIGYVVGTGVISNTGVLSVNGNAGALTMDTGYIANFFTKVRSLSTAGTGISIVNGVISSTVTGVGDASTNTSSSVDNELTLFSSTTGKLLKRSAGTGFVKATSGVVSYSATIGSSDLVSSLAFTGVPTTTAVAANDSSLKVAPTSFVMAAVNLPVYDTNYFAGGLLQELKSISATGHYYIHRTFGGITGLRADYSANDSNIIYKLDISTNSNSTTDSVLVMRGSDSKLYKVSFNKVLAQGGTPSAVIEAAAGSGATGSVTRGRDQAFNVQVACGSSPTTGTLATITFGNAFPVTPIVSINCVDQAYNAFRAQPSTTTILIVANSAPTAGVTYNFNITCIGTQ